MRLVIVAAALAAAGCGGSANNGSSGSAGSTPPVSCTESSAIATTAVTLAGMSFSPSCVKIPTGGTITFTTENTATLHTVTADSGQAVSFDSGPMSNGQQYQHTFTSVGTVNVHCTYHVAMGMRATIIVHP